MHAVSGQEHDLPYRVELWDDRDTHVEELIAVVGDHFVARAAFDEAVRRRPGKLVTLRQKTRLLADSRCTSSISENAMLLGRVETPKPY